MQESVIGLPATVNGESIRTPPSPILVVLKPVPKIKVSTPPTTTSLGSVHDSEPPVTLIVPAVELMTALQVPLDVIVTPVPANKLIASNSPASVFPTFIGLLRPLTVISHPSITDAKYPLKVIFSKRLLLNAFVRLATLHGSENSEPLAFISEIMTPVQPVAV